MIETNRLLIRLFENDDADDYFEFAKDPRVGLNAGWQPYKTKKEAIKSIKLLKKNKNIYAIVLKSENKVIGKIGLYDNLPVSDFFNLKQKSLGFCINPNYWNKGYAKEAANAFTNQVLKNSNIDVLWCYCFSYNTMSEKVIKSLNFNYYNEIIYDAVDIGKKALSKVFYITKDEYLRK